MQFSLALAISIYVVFVAGAPIISEDPPKTSHLYLCTDESFKGQCENFEVEPGKCYNVPEGYKSKISSGGPDNGTFCAVYGSDECKGKAFPFTFPGVMNLTRYGYGDKASSYRCDLLGGLDELH
ncbi:unnamed protein product [Periconia digitata]|uniref:Uncharacterized protein n=1 Tax=Periconia digitata TaxID=1303443 RepID=A0A9W4UK13_9PLEO|nr:unnamed protein product [Periconia digitata]